MVIRNNMLPVHTHAYFFFSVIHKLSCLPTFYFVFSVKGCFLLSVSKYVISHLSDNAKKMLQFSE